MWELSRGHSGIRFDTKGLQKKLRDGDIVRPGFVEFVNYIQSLGYLVYIYTASDKAWANVIISQIEKVFNIRFERPIFTRQECQFTNNQFMKSISFIQKGLTRSLIRKHIPTMDLYKRVTIIDNTNVWHNADQVNLVVCPSYSYRHPENIACQISHELFQKHLSTINDVMIKYIPEYNSPTYDYWSFQRRVSIFYVNSIGLLKQSQSQIKQDRFFYQLIKLFHAHPKHVFAKYINRSLRNNV